MDYCFGDYILDTQRLELCHQGHRVALRPKVFDVLAYLVRHPDHVVGKQELLTALWPHVQASPAALSACIKLARQVSFSEVAFNDFRSILPQACPAIPLIGCPLAGTA